MSRFAGRAATAASMLVFMVGAAAGLAEAQEATAGDAVAAAEGTVDATAEPAAGAADAEAAVVDEAAEGAAESDAPKLTDPKTAAKLDRDARFSKAPPSLNATEHDLLLLNSGEWLQGNIDGIRDDTISFDSIELEDIEIDFADVKEIHANRMHTYRFEGRRDVITGPLRMDATTMVIGNEERKRTAFMSMVPGKPKEMNYWNGDLSVGFSVSSGNTNQSDLTTRVELNRETALTRFSNKYQGSFSTAAIPVDTTNPALGDTTTRTANSHRVNSSFDYYMTNRLYLIVPAAEVFSDEFQNIALRITPSAGAGLEFFKQKYAVWSASASAGYTYTSRVSVQPGEEQSSSNAAVILSTSLELDPTSSIEWDTNYAVQVIPADMDLTNHTLTSLVSIDLFRSLDLDITFGWDRLEGPTQDEFGVTPKQNDYRLTFGVGWDF